MLRAFDQWLLPYLLRPRRRTDVGSVVHVILSVCDHFEPFHDTDFHGAMETMRVWQERWPVLARSFQDSAGNGPRHTFFYPIEQYEPHVLDALASLCHETRSEVEIHLHHHNDTPAGLEEKLAEGISRLRSHGCLASDANGAVRFGFVHGNWALDDSDPEGKNCGVANEIGVLRRQGCYADFTMPSVPHGSQTRTINSIYYAEDTPARKSHDRGISVTSNQTAVLREQTNMLLMVQGPLGLNWHRRKWGVLPRIENGELSGTNPPSGLRLRLWHELAPRVHGGPPWLFVKLHTHGGVARNYSSLLGSPMRKFYETLATASSAQSGIRYHYASAREMVNMIHAAEDGRSGNPEEFRNYWLRRAT